MWSPRGLVVACLAARLAGADDHPAPVGGRGGGRGGGGLAGDGRSDWSRGLDACSAETPCSMQCGRSFVPLVSECAAFFELTTNVPADAGTFFGQRNEASYLQEAWNHAKSCPDPVESTSDLLTADLPYTGRPGVVATVAQCEFVADDGTRVVDGSDLAQAHPLDAGTCSAGGLHGCAHSFNAVVHRCTQQLPHAMGWDVGAFADSIQWKPWAAAFQDSCAAAGGGIKETGGRGGGGARGTGQRGTGGAGGGMGHPRRGRHVCERNRFRAILLLCDIIDSHSDTAGRRNLRQGSGPPSRSRGSPQGDAAPGGHSPGGGPPGLGPPPGSGPPGGSGPGGGGPGGHPHGLGPPPFRSHFLCGDDLCQASQDAMQALYDQHVCGQPECVNTLTDAVGECTDTPSVVSDGLGQCTGDAAVLPTKPINHDTHAKVWNRLHMTVVVKLNQTSPIVGVNETLVQMVVAAALEVPTNAVQGVRYGRDSFGRRLRFASRPIASVIPCCSPMAMP